MEPNEKDPAGSAADEQAPAGESARVGFEADEAPRPKKSRRKLFTVLGIIAAVIIVAGIGGFIWHESPSFCNAICHDPMDPYVEGYYSGDASLLVTAHAAEGDECLDCHKPTIGEQVSELFVWISGDYKTPLPMTKIGTRDFCMECHDDAEMKAATENYNGTSRNPHDSHYGDTIECYSCHRVHRTSTMYCNECHPDISGPSGWEK